MEAERLRPVQESDLATILQWRNSPRIRNSMFSDHIITWDEHIRWFARVQEDQRTVPLLYEIAGTPVGVTNFTAIDQSSRRCEWGFYIGPENTPKGTGFRMGCLALDYAFDHLDLRKVCGEVLAENTPSLHFHLKLGFSQEGYFRKHFWKGNEFHDVVFFSIFKDDWQAHHPDLVADSLPSR